MKVVRGFFSGVFAFLLFDALVLLGLVIAINLTVLNADFVTSELDKFDVYSVVVDRAKALIPSQQFIDDEAIDEVATELKPWFEEQADKAIHDVYAYLKEGQELNVVISLEPVRAAVKEKVKESVIKSLPPELQDVAQSQIDDYVSQAITKIDDVIPSSFTLNAAVAGSLIMVPLDTVKHVVGYVDTAYKGLIAAAILLVLFVALVHWWQPKPITRSVGITFILVGVACVVASLLHSLIAQVLGQLVGLSGIMPGLQSNLIQLVADITSPVRMYGIGFLSAGVVLVIISVLFRKPETSSDERKA